jgi:hypothetical protein
MLGFLSREGQLAGVSGTDAGHPTLQIGIYQILLYVTDIDALRTMSSRFLRA